MKYICRYFAENPNGSCYNKNDIYGCEHGEPHEILDESCASMGINYECVCIPMDLEYYMRKIIREHEEKKK